MELQEGHVELEDCEYAPRASGEPRADRGDLRAERESPRANREEQLGIGLAPIAASPADSADAEATEAVTTCGDIGKNIGSSLSGNSEPDGDEGLSAARAVSDATHSPLLIAAWSTLARASSEGGGVGAAVVSSATSIPKLCLKMSNSSLSN